LFWAADLGASRAGEAAWVDERDETPVGGRDLAERVGEVLRETSER